MMYSNLGETELAAQNTRRAYGLRHRVSDRERFWIEFLFDRQVTGNLKRAQETLDALVASTPHAQWRQIAVLDAAGDAAAYSGTRTKAEMSAVPAQDVCALGNILANVRVPPAMVRAFQADPVAPLAERLLQALEEGLAAGGEHAPVRSAHLLVVERESFPLIDLRVDWHDTPVAELRSLWLRYAPQSNDYLLRAVDPDNPAIL